MLTPAEANLVVPAKASGDAWIFGALALMMAVVPAVGVPHEEMLQDTLKSALVAFGTLGAALAFLVLRARKGQPLPIFRWHPGLLLPVLLALGSLSSMVWSHTYLAAVESIRWTLLALLAWVCMNVVSVARMPQFAMMVHVGAGLASLWGALQFWVDLSWFPQGPNPASTFVNRNFAAEWVVVAFPFSVWALLQLKHAVGIAFMALSLGLNVVFLCMTGTRSALVCLAVLACTMPWVIKGLWPCLPASRWTRQVRWLCGTVFLASIINLGLLPSGNPRILAENQAQTSNFSAFHRAYLRSESTLRAEEYTRHSFSVRLTMWRATWAMIKARPFSGVGGGAWEVDIPLYQEPGAQLETDYYAHNEYLQVVGEYGLIGWVFLLGLLGFFAHQAYLLWTGVRHLRTSKGNPAEHPALQWRTVACLSLASLLLVSLAGFPWHLATTGAMLALCLGIMTGLAPERVPATGQYQPWYTRWMASWPLPGMRVARFGAATCAISLPLAAYITWQAARSEQLIVHAVKMALTISASGQAEHPKWVATKTAMLDSLKAGIAINPHYRKITPMVADELARWGDWRNAVWVWESVAASRPHVVVLLTNIARGHIQLGDLDTALAYLIRAKALQPNASTVVSLEVILLSRSGQIPEAAELARKSLDTGTYDLDLLNAAVVLASQVNDEDLALSALTKRNARWPRLAVDGWLKIGHIHASGTKHRNDELAVLAYAEALRLAGPAGRPLIMAHIPENMQQKAMSLVPAGQPPTLQP